MSNKVDILAKKPAYETAREQDKPLTLNEAKAKLCVWAEGQVGFREGPDNENRYADNADLKRMYGWDPQNQPWCDVFVDVGFIECFGLDAACAMTYQPTGAGSALCRQSAQYYKDAGAWFTRPEIGDQIFFYVSGEINHTGIVVGVDGGSVITVEGNSSDQVAERVYSIGDSRIAGYGRPKWGVVTGGVVFVEDNNVAGNTTAPDGMLSGIERYYFLAFPYLKRGDTGKAVASVQFELFAQGYNIGPDGADGDFGRNTERAVMEFQRNVGLPADGIVGPDTAALLYGAVGKKFVNTEDDATESGEEAKKDGLWDSIKNRFGKGGKAK